MMYRLLKRADDVDVQYILSMYLHPFVSRYISIDEENYWRYVTSTDNVYFYKIYKDNELVGTVHLELADNILYMDIVVFPDYQRRGIATKALRDIQEGKLTLDFDKIQVSIDEKNVASLKLFENAGFVCVGKDEELLEYEYIKS